MRGVLLSLLLAWQAFAAEVRIDPPAPVKPGRLLRITATASDPKAIRWVNTNPDLDLIESETGRWAIASSPKAGRYRIAAYSDAGGPPTYVDVVVEGETPAPVPPRPVDPPSPVDPPAPTPVPTGPLRVLVLYESEDLPRMKPGQLDALYSRKVRDALDDACAADGPVKAWRVWDRDTDASAASKEWQAALARARRPARVRAAAVGVPKVVAFRSEEHAGEWALPDSEAGMLALVARIRAGGGK